MPLPLHVSQTHFVHTFSTLAEHSHTFGIYRAFVLLGIHSVIPFMRITCVVIAASIVPTMLPEGEGLFFSLTYK